MASSLGRFGLCCQNCVGELSASHHNFLSVSYFTKVSIPRQSKIQSIFSCANRHSTCRHFNPSATVYCCRVVAPTLGSINDVLLKGSLLFSRACQARAVHLPSAPISQEPCPASYCIKIFDLEICRKISCAKPSLAVIAKNQLGPGAVVLPLTKLNSRARVENLWRMEENEKASCFFLSHELHFPTPDNEKRKSHPFPGATRSARPWSACVQQSISCKPQFPGSARA